MLRLAMKYNVRHIADEALDRLRICYPPTLHDFEDSVAVRAEREDDPVIFADEDCIAVIALARAYDFSFLLPQAFYECCQLPGSRVLKGASVERERITLSDEDMKLYMDGREALLRCNTSTTNVYSPGARFLEV